MTAEIIRWTRHRMGGPFTCSTCGASEDELATECPGYRLHADERAAVMNGHLDFQRGAWRNRGA